MTLHEGVLRLSRSDPSQHDRLPIDHFLQSLARDQQERAACVILSGSGADGAEGARDIMAAGGVVIAQDPATARFDGMPNSVIATGVVDYVLPIADMPSVLDRLAGVRRRVAEGPRGDQAARLPGLLALLRARLGFNFEAYKRNTLLRRIRRRMNLRQASTLADYIAILRDDPEETQALGRDFLIGVTEFFREPEAWKTLEKEVVQPLVRRASPGQPIRVWVAGCATGEEAYSIALTFLEHIHAAGRAIGLQVLASDVSEEALATARAGRYPKRIETHVSPERLRRFFAPAGDDGHWQVRKELRDVVVFAVQNLLGDPPYSHMDLICCRNLLIYLEPDIQQRILSLFHFALKPDGALFLGPAESVGRFESLFLPLSKKWRLFRRVVSPAVHAPVPSLPAAVRAPALVPSAASRAGRDIKVAAVAQQLVLDRFAPAAVLVNGRHEAIHLSGPTDLYLRHPRGLATHDLLQLAREGLSAGLRDALASASARKAAVVFKDLRVKRGGEFCPVRITVMPVTPAGTDDPDLRLVVFEEDRRPPSSRAGRRHAPDADVVSRLESELLVARGELKANLEQLDTSNEEFRASNEEVMSINEELQATNEELETSREELQSLNEELSTVNSQLQFKVSELEQANNDLGNLLASTEIATLCLDREHRIKWFTPPTTRLLRLLPEDRGRSIRDFATRFKDGDLVQEVDAVMRTLAPREHPVHTEDGRWYVERVLPYRTEADRVDGVVITFVDMTATHQAEETLRALNETLERRVQERTRLLELLKRAAVIANEAPNLDEALAQTLALVCTQGGWVVGHALLSDLHDPDALADSGVWWWAPSFGNRSYEQALRGFQYRAGTDPIGRVIAGGEPAWLPDLAQIEPTPWSTAARAAGLRSALILPVRVGSKTVGVFKLFSAESPPVEGPSLEVLMEIGIQLGRAVERSRFESRLMSFVDAERQQIAQGLHDGIGQRLAGLGMLTASLRQSPAERGRPDEGRLDELVRIIEETRHEVRAITRGLLPVELEAGGLMSALENLATHYRQVAGLDCRFEYETPVRIEDNATATQLFRIAQEAVRNAVEHGRARLVRIALEYRERVILTIRDDGVGMTETTEEGSGIRIMRHRADLIGARLNIATGQGEGTVVTCALPRGTTTDGDSLAGESAAALEENVP